MFIWTYIIESGTGTTSICQVEAEDVESSILAFNESEVAQENGYCLPNKKSVPAYGGLNGPTGIQGTENVWCLDGPEDCHDLFLANVVKTFR